MLLVLVAVAILTYSSLVYFAERDKRVSDQMFDSVMSTFSGVIGRGRTPQLHWLEGQLHQQTLNGPPLLLLDLY